MQAMGSFMHGVTPLTRRCWRRKRMKRENSGVARHLNHNQKRTTVSRRLARPSLGPDWCWTFVSPHWETWLRWRGRVVNQLWRFLKITFGIIWMKGKRMQAREKISAHFQMTDNVFFHVPWGGPAAVSRHASFKQPGLGQFGIHREFIQNKRLNTFILCVRAKHVCLHFMFWCSSGQLLNIYQHAFWGFFLQMISSHKLERERVSESMKQWDKFLFIRVAVYTVVQQCLQMLHKNCSILCFLLFTKHEVILFFLW